MFDYFGSQIRQGKQQEKMGNTAAYRIQQGKKLSCLLRHDKSYAFDEHGWREVSDLVANHGFTMES